MQSRAMFVVFVVSVGVLKSFWRDHNSYIEDLEAEIGSEDYAVVSSDWEAGTRALVCNDTAALSEAEVRINAVFSKHNIQAVDLAEMVSADLEADPETKAVMASACVAQPTQSFTHLGPGL